MPSHRKCLTSNPGSFRSAPKPEVKHNIRLPWVSFQSDLLSSACYTVDWQVEDFNTKEQQQASCGVTKTVLAFPEGVGLAVVGSMPGRATLSSPPICKIGYAAGVSKQWALQAQIAVLHDCMGQHYGMIRCLGVAYTLKDMFESFEGLLALTETGFSLSFFFYTLFVYNIWEHLGLLPLYQEQVGRNRCSS